MAVGLFQIRSPAPFGVRDRGRVRCVFRRSFYGRRRARSTPPCLNPDFVTVRRRAVRSFFNGDGGGSRPVRSCVKMICRMVGFGREKRVHVGSRAGTVAGRRPRHVQRPIRAVFRRDHRTTWKTGGRCGTGGAWRRRVCIKVCVLCVCSFETVRNNSWREVRFATARQKTPKFEVVFVPELRWACLPPAGSRRRFIFQARATPPPLLLPIRLHPYFLSPCRPEPRPHLDAFAGSGMPGTPVFGGAAGRRGGTRGIGRVKTKRIGAGKQDRRSMAVQVRQLGQMPLHHISDITLIPHRGLPG